MEVEDKLAPPLLRRSELQHPYVASGSSRQIGLKAIIIFLKIVKRYWLYKEIADKQTDNSRSRRIRKPKGIAQETCSVNNLNFFEIQNSVFQKIARYLRNSPRAINTFSLISSQKSRRENLAIFLFFDLSTAFRPSFLSKYGRNFIGSISSCLITGPGELKRFGVLSSSKFCRKLKSSSIFALDDKPEIFFFRLSCQVNLL